MHYSFIYYYGIIILLGEMIMNKFMKIAKESAENGMILNEGGPFGAVITDKDSNIISVGNNQVLKNNDPTAHAEVIAIRNACKKLNTYDYLIAFYTHLVSLVQCAYLLLYGRTLKIFTMHVLAKMPQILDLEMILFMNI